jgi:hypothetical protein
LPGSGKTQELGKPLKRPVQSSLGLKYITGLFDAKPPIRVAAVPHLLRLPLMHPRRDLLDLKNYRPYCRFSLASSVEKQRIADKRVPLRTVRRNKLKVPDGHMNKVFLIEYH